MARWNPPPKRSGPEAQGLDIHRGVLMRLRIPSGARSKGFGRHPSLWRGYRP
jgi:hypothetical protein